MSRIIGKGRGRRTTPAAYSLAFQLMRGELGEIIGTIGLSVIKDADLAVGSLSDVHKDGFIAFSNFQIPTEDGERVGALTTKGTYEQVANLPQAVQAVAADYYRYI
ncbi:MAG: hypothetical protein U1D96_08235 [Eubacteriales bacterium]|nr:hypothetical protein [Bacillota bacterium]MDP3051600.1 hypothetical protein [Eubacteriales bacterium]MDQ7790312.1 hypothetical protein [Clostridia bacterium]MDZ4043465.1 hypothetical protein [Eubacteriales bacterium]MDZ7609326.1 hypothetical protein [Eubacteriales bacterium]